MVQKSVNTFKRQQHARVNGLRNGKNGKERKEGKKVAISLNEPCQANEQICKWTKITFGRFLMGMAFLRLIANSVCFPAGREVGTEQVGKMALINQVGFAGLDGDGEQIAPYQLVFQIYSRMERLGA